ncbi:MAG: metallophosphoesterase [Eubacteriales bacterium]|nr:metallophosphoesterase [Eubacteriales bacterium]
MKFLIVSDTHGKERNLEAVLEKVGPLDGLIHLGDLEGGENHIRKLVDAPLYMVAGNNDFYTDLPGELEVELGGHLAFLTHGHGYFVSRDSERLAQEGRRRGADIVMYGHTHVPELERRDGMTILNPGSLSLPRQEGRKPSYIVMEIDREGEAHYTICYLERNLCWGL